MSVDAAPPEPVAAAKAALRASLAASFAAADKPGCAPPTDAGQVARSLVGQQINQHLQAALVPGLSVLAYRAMDHEPSVAAFAAAYQAAGGRVAWVPPTARRPQAVALPAHIDVVLVPGVAFARTGERLGRGGGFYDRLLLAAPCRRALWVGVSHAARCLPRVPVGPRDQAMDVVVTEGGPAVQPSARRAAHCLCAFWREG